MTECQGVDNSLIPFQVSKKQRREKERKRGRKRFWFIRQEEARNSLAGYHNCLDSSSYERYLQTVDGSQNHDT